MLQREYLPLDANVLNKSRNSSNITNREVFQVSFYQSDKPLSWRFHKFLETFNILNVEGCHETGLFRHLPKHSFHSL